MDVIATAVAHLCRRIETGPVTRKDLDISGKPPGACASEPSLNLLSPLDVFCHPVFLEPRRPVLRGLFIEVTAAALSRGGGSKYHNCSES